MDRNARIIAGLEHAVVSGKKEDSVRHARNALKNGVSAMDAIDNGLIKGMTIIGDRYSQHKIFLPQVLLAADAMYAALDILLPHLSVEAVGERAVIVIGVVEGDVHDIGKNIVKAMMVAAGYDVRDLGKDQPEDAFVREAKLTKASIVAMSTLMTPTMDSMKTTIDAMVEDGVRTQTLIMVGGPPTSQEAADEMGADLYAMNAQEAVARIRSALATKKK
ncbi:MAG: corrinoid protein [Methanomassiliicoccus sp.]|nr:corrinoid protein [Methanomassiliicoccus sp.]